MRQQRARAVGTAWLKLGLTCALQATVALGCNGEPSAVENELSVGASAQRLAFGGHEYVVVTTARTWADAAQSCASMGMGLVTLESSAENDWLLPRQPAGDVWLGLNDRATEGLWRWMDGSSSYTRWATGEPNNSGNEDCAASYSASGRWDDLPCTLTRPFICESLDTPQALE